MSGTGPIQGPDWTPHSRIRPSTALTSPHALSLGPGAPCQFHLASRAGIGSWGFMYQNLALWPAGLLMDLWGALHVRWHIARGWILPAGWGLSTSALDLAVCPQQDQGFEVLSLWFFDFMWHIWRTNFLIAENLEVYFHLLSISCWASPFEYMEEETTVIMVLHSIIVYRSPFFRSLKNMGFEM